MSVRMVKLWDVWDFLKLSGIVVDIAWLHHGIYRIHWDDDGSPEPWRPDDVTIHVGLKKAVVEPWQLATLRHPASTGWEDNDKSRRLDGNKKRQDENCLFCTVSGDTVHAQNMLDD